MTYNILSMMSKVVSSISSFIYNYTNPELKELVELMQESKHRSRVKSPAAGATEAQPQAAAIKATLHMYNPEGYISSTASLPVEKEATLSLRRSSSV